jgi:radical SAM protein with 4Fe4S-binding SPASM domain
LSFDFDNTKYQWLKNLTVDNIDGCQNCFAKHNCKGDCPIVKYDFSDNFAKTKSPKCESIKKITEAMFRAQLNI